MLTIGGHRRDGAVVGRRLVTDHGKIGARLILVLHLEAPVCVTGFPGMHDGVASAPQYLTKTISYVNPILLVGFKYLALPLKN